MKPLLISELTGLAKEWMFIRVNQEKIQDGERLRQSVERFVFRKCGKGWRVRSMQVGYNGDDLVMNKFTIAIRFFLPQNN